MYAIVGGELYHSSDFTEDELAHFGVKGMKWGKRKSRPRVKNSRKNNAEALNRKLSKMSDNEVQQYVNRLRNEQAIRELRGVTSNRTQYKEKFGTKLREKSTDRLAETLVKTAFAVPATVAAAYVAKNPGAVGDYMRRVFP